MTTLVAVPGPGHHHENLEEEFWAEAAHKERIEDEEQKGNVTDEGELEADWLSEVGLGEWTQQWRQGKSLPENDIGPAVQKLSLKPHQADAVRRRVRTLNATLKRKKHHRRPPDVRSFFQNDITENKDSSRSATPDSLDSNEFLSSDSPPRRSSSPNVLDHPNSHSADELDDLVPQMPNQVPNFVSIFAHEHQQYNQNAVASASPPNRSKDIFKPRFQVRGSSNATIGEIASDTISGIEMLNYHNVGTVYMKGYIPSKIRNSSAQAIMNSSPLSLPNQSVNTTEINSRTYSAFASQKNGFTEELNRRNGNSMPEVPFDDEDLINEDAYIDPSGLTRLSDLSEEDIKKIRPLLLMELTAQCDLMNIQVRRKKVNKNQKKSTFPPEDGASGIFGVNLEALLAKDKQVTGDNQLEVPIIFDKLVTHLTKRSLCEEGLLRMAGHKGKINDLRATFESSLYSEPEQVDAAMNQCSSHDVANLLKQFLRELPIPLLGFEYIDTFFDVAGQMKGKIQENSLRLLVLLLPQSHQAVLRMLVQLLRDLVKHSESNKMSLKNVALIVAPNLVPTSALRSQNKELSRAATWVKLTMFVVQHGTSLFCVPSDLVSQLRQINDLTKSKKAKGKQNSGGGKVGHSTGSSALAQNCKGNSSCNNLIVSAPQLGFPEVMLPINAGTTAGDVVLLLLEEADRKAEDLEREASNNNNLNARRRAGPRAQELNKNGPNLSCLLTQMNRDMALKTHSLYEIGGNIGYRRVDPSALLPAICRDNPCAAWVLRCNHRHSTTNI
ncbi:unnamed protein product [Allacma fusca]|uniref:Rho-GAP domain-containing protein n=1 Tax=Allacma fusca TaxID=39272 RepID=A0A8J2PSK9_9HEXA|nr:unnamed protein product [Allacma fusca]